MEELIVLKKKSIQKSLVLNSYLIVCVQNVKVTCE